MILQEVQAVVEVRKNGPSEAQPVFRKVENL
jgi:hypothetical protein